MSYCVECGVELAKGEKHCPLCETVVQNPNDKQDQPVIKSYPTLMDAMNRKIDRRVRLIIISIVMAVPALICILADFFTTKTMTWSWYALGGIAFCWCIFATPQMFEKNALLKSLFLDSIFLIAYMYLINEITPSESKDWFLAIALPIILVIIATFIINLTYIKAAIVRGFYIITMIFSTSGVMTLGLEAIIDLYKDGDIQLQWSFFVLIPCIAVALIAAVIEKKKSVKSEIKKRLHM